MKIYLKTEVSGNYLTVFQQFDRKLFEALAPPFPKPLLLRFDGSKQNDQVHIQLVLPFGIKQDWVSLITEDGQDETLAWFVDEGIKLPFFLSKWKHRHIIEKKTENSSYIIDDIEFSSPFVFLLYPVLWLQFAWRKPVYRRYFLQISGN